MIKIKEYLSETAIKNNLEPNTLQFPDCEINPEKIKVIMINEVVPKNPDDWFYSKTQDAENRKTALGLFETAGISVKSMRDILDLGIYITTALKTPKTGYTAAPDVIKAQIPILESELALFPNLKLIMLMGDVAIKTFNKIAKAKTKKNIIPAESTYKIRNNIYYYGDIRVFPSYIMTGKNLLIEPFKRDTISEDIKKMLEILEV